MQNTLKEYILSYNLTVISHHKESVYDIHLTHSGPLTQNQGQVYPGCSRFNTSEGITKHNCLHDKLSFTLWST